ncbi:MAG: hypothetical protein WA517_08130 [Candidatus Acidiferrum sp.]
MLKTLEKAVAGISILAAIAYSLGWLKSLFYFETFGLGLPSLDLTVQYYLFESWFVIENLVFFVLLSWVLQACFRLELRNKVFRVLWWIALAGLAYLYLMLPNYTDRAFSQVKDCAALQVKWWPMSQAWLPSHYNSLLKFIPFVVYGILAVVIALELRFRRNEHPSFGRLQRLEHLLSAQSGHHLVVYSVVVLAWSISLAKHVGVIDAKTRLVCPEQNLSSVAVHLAPNSPKILKDENLEQNQNLYLLHESPNKYFIWDKTGFVFGNDQKIRILAVPRGNVEWISTSKAQTKPLKIF